VALTDANAVAASFGWLYTPQPELTRLGFSGGPAAGGTPVTIEGRGLASVTSVRFGALEATSIGQRGRRAVGRRRTRSRDRARIGGGGVSELGLLGSPARCPPSAPGSSRRAWCPAWSGQGPRIAERISVTVSIVSTASNRHVESNTRRRPTSPSRSALLGGDISPHCLRRAEAVQGSAGVLL